MFFSPFSIAITSLGEERANLSAYLTFCSICAYLVLSVSSSSWCLGKAAVSDCGTPWTFLLPFFFCIDLEVFQRIKVCRPISCDNMYYDGLAILLRKSKRNGIKILKNSNSEYRWIKLTKNYFDLEKMYLYVFLMFHHVPFRIKLILIL